jgi:hypothetical protein
MKAGKQENWNTDVQSVRPAELNSAEFVCSGQNARRSHRQDACVPIS